MIGPGNVVGATLDRMEMTDLRAELQTPEAAGLMLAYLALLEGRVRRLAAYRERGVPTLTLLDLIIIAHITAFTVARGDGTRPSDLTDTLDAPRGTIRDGLSRLAQAGIIVRDAAGLYHPTKLVAEVTNEYHDDAIRDLERLCAALSKFRQSH
jgi:hypothetical protein